MSDERLITPSGTGATVPSIEWETRVVTLQEKDPNGIDQHAAGAKLDYGKIRPYLVQQGFIHALQEVWKDGSYGAKKYSDNGWKEVPDAKNRYMDAFARHYDKHLLGEKYDSESEVHHLGACIWNLLAVLELELTQ
jgi:hypothetical protein